MNIGIRQIIVIIIVSCLFFFDIPKISKKLIELGVKIKNQIKNKL